MGFIGHPIYDEELVINLKSSIVNWDLPLIFYQCSEDEYPIILPLKDTCKVS